MTNSATRLSMEPQISNDNPDTNPSSVQEELAIKVTSVTIAYRSYQQRPTTLKENILNFVKSGKFRYYSSFNALSDISFEVPKGQILGVIGSNGAGKSTLLNMLAGVLPPSQGTLEINGSMDSLRSLGAGFDSELNAIENIYLYGSLHRQSREQIRKRVPEIIKFAELEDFANTPIKYYSSGMNARLGFACAIDKNPDILLVDEVLGVGDERFQKKCDAVFDRFFSEGRTVVIVSHNMNSLKRLCKKIMVIERGKKAFVGEPEEAIEFYRNSQYQTALAKS